MSEALPYIAAAIAIINLVVTVGGGFFFAGRVTARMDAHDVNAARVETDVHEVKSLLVSSAVEASALRRAEADIVNLEEDFRNLRKGIGWIKDRDATTIDRQY